MANPLLSGCPFRLLAMGLLAVTFCAVDTEKDGSGRSQEKKSGWNETGSLLLASSNNLNSSIRKIHHNDSRDAWLLLMKQSSNGVNSKKGDKSKSKKGKYSIPGPSELAGPLGPPGVMITREELLREFRTLLKGAIRDRERINLKACENCEEEKNRGREENKFLAQFHGPMLESREQGRVVAAFYCRTRRNISIERRSLQELQLYYIPKNGERFHRGLGLNLTNGQYEAPLSGYYIFSATLHVVPENYPTKNRPHARDRLRLLICIQSLCRQNISLKTVSRLDPNKKHFTISVNGVLFMLAGQYASVFVDNASGTSLTIRRGSDFSAILLGI
ncbi:hypothetical protein JRQ81_018047 [Phrynocephalus forsythii]|uniref:Erythroferrone n=1 Tax=Phrynocephalus forsythii TaxID=171643 RepID=A0A9Q0XTG1_9SAUR|nr:hypothetical protein JRQ81_018047 [Phrynocephalus forsythii]